MGCPGHFHFPQRFSGMTANSPFYRICYHKAVVEVNRTRDEAAAATGVVTEGRSYTINVIANHPFVFLIRENIKGSILFIGRIVDQQNINIH